jgi:hypothetical protein
MFSPDGQWVGFLVGHVLKKVALTGGEPVKLCELESPPYGISWTEGDTLLVGDFTTGAIVRVPASGGMTLLKDSELGKMGRFNCPLIFEAAVKLNGKNVSLAPSGMASDYFLLDASALVKGENTLSVKGFYCNMHRDLPGTEQGPLVPGFVVKPVERKDLDFQFGPVLGVAGPDFLTVTCRLNQPAVVTPAVTLLDPTRAEAVTAPPSPRGVFHRIRLSLPAGTRAVSYTLTASADGGKITKTAGPLTVKLPDFTGKALRFAAMGQSDGGSWTKIAAVVLKTRPDLVVHTGCFNYFPQMENPWSGALTPPEVRGLLAQYKALLAADGVTLEMDEGACREVARMAMEMNSREEDIGARRLRTVLTHLLDEYLFGAPDLVSGFRTVTAADARVRLSDLAGGPDEEHYIL